MVKEEMNAFDVRALVDELAFLTAGRFDKAYQPSREEVLLRFYVPRDADTGVGGSGTRKDLAILSGRWMCLTTTPRENPTTPPGFSMLLRRRVAGGRILAVRQHLFDRVVEIDVGKREATFTLVVELFRDGNVILVRRPEEPEDDDLGTIEATLLQQQWAHRTIRPGRPFRHAPSRTEPFGLLYEAFRERFLASDSDAVRTLATGLDLGGTYAEEVCARADVPRRTPVSECVESQVQALHAALEELGAIFAAGALDPVLVRDADGNLVDVAPIPLRRHEGMDLEHVATFNEALDRYFSKPATKEERTGHVDRFQKERARVARRLDQQERAIERFEVETEEKRRLGDLLYGRFDQVQRILSTLLEAVRDRGWDEVKERLAEGREAGNEDAERVVRLNPHEGLVTLRLADAEGAEHDVTLDVRRTVQENAESMYRASKKAREKRAGATGALERTRAQLAEMDRKGAAMVAELERREAEAKREPTHRFWFERYRWFVARGGFVVVAGRDASSNEEVVRRHLEPNDRYVHADLHGAPSVVVKARDGETPSEEALEEACAWGVAMSRAWGAGGASGQAYWVTPPQVSRTPEAGEHLARGAFIVRGRRNHVSAPLELAVGEVEIEGERKVMGAPPAALRDRSSRYVVIVPGRGDRNGLANRLAELFHVPVEEVQRVLPPGDVDVTEVHGLPEDQVGA